MTEILLEGLEFYAYHGVYGEEQKMGNRFQVDIRIQVEAGEASLNDDLDKTLDYVQVYALTQKLMQERFRLLETLGQQIADAIRAASARVRAVEVTVSKFNPPLSGLCRRVAVTSRWSADQA